MEREKADFLFCVGAFQSDDEYDERPKAPRKKRKSKSGDGDDDEFVGTEAKKARGLAAISENEKNRLVGEIARYLLFSESTKPLTTRQELSKAVLAPSGASGNLLTPLLPLASEQLQQIFGWELLTTPTFTAKGKFEEAGKTHMLMRMSPELQEFMAPVRQELPPEPNQAFLMIVLSLILMHNFAIDEDVMLANLAKFGLDNKPNELFGKQTSAELLKELAKYHYISIKKVNEGGNSTHQINIGARSLLEIGKVNILRFINSVCKTSIDPSALREFLTEQNDYLPNYAVGEEPIEQRNQPRRPAQTDLEVVEDEPAHENGNDEANGVANGHADAAPKRGAKAAGRKAKAAAAAAPEEIEVEEAPQNGRGRRNSRR